MIVRSYSGRTMAEALEKVRNDLGDGALIIETRTVRDAGLLGRTAGIEVVAARDDSAPSQSRPSASQPSASQAGRSPSDHHAAVQAWHTPELAAQETQAAGLRREAQAPAGSKRAESTAIEDELATIRRQLARLAAGQGTPVGHLGEEFARQLEDSELPAEHIAELDAACAKAGARLDPAKRGEFAALLLAKSLPQVAPLDWSTCRRLMVVGATGVGKTTTLAKLAGELVLNRRKRVALVTIDTYRVGAHEQLKAYADLLDVPLEVAATPAQLGRLLERYAACDHILIDTAGRSPADTARVHELKGFCRSAPGISVMLATAATAGRAEFAAVVERFSILPLEHVVVTKLDECVAPGRLYGSLRRHRLPVRFVTTGQEVPQDIQPASAEFLARQVVLTPELV